MPPKKSVIDGDSINFKELGRVVDRQLEADAKYDRENDAKFRAIRQKVATYEEFENIVIGAHLKPMKEDVANLNLKNTGWDSTGRARQRTKQRLNQGGGDDDDTDVEKSHATPASSQDVARVWKRLKSDTDKYTYLLDTMGSSAVKELFKGGIDSLLGSFVTVLASGYKTEDRARVIAMLCVFTTTSRFALAVDFLEHVEQMAVESLFKNLRESVQTEIEEEALVLENLRLLYFD